MRSGIKVVHICTSDIGGAAIAAQRLHAGLLQQGAQSTFLTWQQHNPHQYPFKCKIDQIKRPSFSKRLRKQFGVPSSQQGRNNEMIKGLTGNYEMFSFPYSDFRVEEHPKIKEADIIHLHWVSNFINYPTFFKKIKKPIVWTFHDMNPFMGGFHYQGDLERNKKIFGALEDRFRQEKLEEIAPLNNLSIVTPSEWLGSHAGKHLQLKNKPYYHIPYSLDTAVFKIQDQKFARDVFNLPHGKRIILFVSDRLTNYRKGFDLLLDALKLLNAEREYLLVAIGERSEALTGENNICLGRIQDDRLLSLLFASADAFVLPSREDNFPNVMLESLACGTPVIAFKTGGMQEVIQDGVNGILANEISPGGLRLSIESFLKGEYHFDRTKICADAASKFALHVQAKAYIGLYESILRGNQ
jgi:glycosyltransferase involved in cell wall biosynthesis